MPYNNYPHRRILFSPRYYPWFEDCIGAIDGTLIPTIVPKWMRHQSIGRKQMTGMNVLAACDHDGLFVFVNAGWEASAHDSHVLHEVAFDVLHKFPVPTGGKYYLVDRGYTNCRGFLAHYNRQRYHQEEFAYPYQPPQNMEEYFNLAHSSLRSIVECCFGILKTRFPILTGLLRYKVERQADVVLALCAVHNFIRIYGKDDELFAKDGFLDDIPTGDAEYNMSQLDWSAASIAYMANQRDSTHNDLWNFMH